jgi:SAM-dependent methyltransferase
MDATDAERLERLLPLAGGERVLELGGTGAIPAATGHEVGPDFTSLPFAADEFDVVAAFDVIRRVRRPELLVAELARVTALGGRILVVDRLAPVDPLAALDLNRVERERDPSVTRVLAEGDLRALFDANSLTLRREEVVDNVGWFALTR